MEIKVDDLRSIEVGSFLEEHIAEMKSVSPPESKHALDLDGLKTPEITFWTVWDNSDLVACSGIKASNILTTIESESFVKYVNRGMSESPLVIKRDFTKIIRFI